jgi:hypothetical protein
MNASGTGPDQSIAINERTHPLCYHLLQFIVTSSGEVGMSYEHSHGEPHQQVVDHMEK